MKLDPVTKIDKINKTTSKKLMMTSFHNNCDVTVIFQIGRQFGRILDA